MNVRAKIKDLLREYEKSLYFTDGNASTIQQAETVNILNSLRFYTTRLMIFCNDEIEGIEDLNHHWRDEGE